jgi:putative FmdB family regulatory protein
MPTYEYACRACGHVFEIVQKMSDDPLVICPECGGALRKVFAPPAISFKGSGFYTTDHGKGAKPAAKTGEGSEKGGEKKAGEKKAGEKKDTASKGSSSEGSSSSARSSTSSDPSSSGSSSSKGDPSS